MREAKALGLRRAASKLGISPAYLSRVETGKEKPPRPETIKRMAALLGGDGDALFRLAASLDPELASYVNSVNNIPEFLRTTLGMGYGEQDFDWLIEQAKRRCADSPTHADGATPRTAPWPSP